MLRPGAKRPWPVQPLRGCRHWVGQVHRDAVMFQTCQTRANRAEFCWFHDARAMKECGHHFPCDHLFPNEFISRLWPR